MSLRLYVSLFLPLMILSAMPLYGGDLKLVENGKPLAEIQLGEKSTVTEQYAAEELERALRLMSGAELAIQRGIKAASRGRIIIGTPEQAEIKARSADLGLGNVKNQRIVVKRLGNDLYLVGGTPAAALSATYVFLQDVLGVRWLWPGMSGEYIPKQPTISIGDVAIDHTPGIAYRMVHICWVADQYDEETEVWAARNLLNTATGTGSETPERRQAIADARLKRGMFQKYLAHGLSLSKETLKAHPEFAAEIGGSRLKHPDSNSHLCWSNEGVQKLLVDKINSWWDENPQMDMMVLMTADNPNFCECAKCREWGNVTDRWQKFAAKLIAGANKAHPGKQYWMLAYQDYRPVPQAPLAPFGMVEYCQYNRCIRHTLEQEDALNAEALGEIKGWQQKGAPVGIYDYSFSLFSEPAFLPLAYLMADQAAYYHRMGLKTFLTEVVPKSYELSRGIPDGKTNWDYNRLALYAMARALWDPNAKAQDIVQDWSRTLFGPAAEAMVGYYNIMEKAWRDAPGHPSYFLQPPASFVEGFITGDVIQSATKKFAEARAAVESLGATPEAERIRRQIDIEEKQFQNWREMFDMLQVRRGRVNLHIPRVEGDSWEGALKLPDFENAKREPVTDYPTEVLMKWDDDALHLRVVSHEKDTGKLLSNATQRDQNVWSDDAVEIFLKTNPSEEGYAHMAINAKGVIYDAKGAVGMNLDPTWNPEWTAKTRLEKGEWITDITLPFKSFGEKPTDGSQWKMGIRRTRVGPGTEHSGWPDASYHVPNALGTIIFSKQKDTGSNRIVLYDPTGRTDSLLVALQQEGWDVAFDGAAGGAGLEELLKSGARALFIWHPEGNDLPLDFWPRTIDNFVKEGGVLFLSAYGALDNLQTYFPDESIGVRWSGWDIDPQRRSVFVESGDWIKNPHDMTEIFATGVTPASGYEPVTPDWNVYAKMAMQDGEEFPYLLSKKIGKGMIVLTSSGLGAHGGFEMFGAQNPKYAAMLVTQILNSNAQ